MSASLSGSRLRQVMGRFLTGVAVVATVDDGVAHGMTVNSLTSVSLDPPLLLVSLTLGARTTGSVRASGRFAVSILSARQEKIAVRFARRGEEHFAGLPLEVGELGLPVVPDALAQLECVVEQEVAAGDHVVVIGRVLRAADRDGHALGFLGGRFCTVNERPGLSHDWLW